MYPITTNQGTIKTDIYGETRYLVSLTSSHQAHVYIEIRDNHPWVAGSWRQRASLPESFNFFGGGRDVSIDTYPKEPHTQCVHILCISHTPFDKDEHGQDLLEDIASQMRNASRGTVRYLPGE